MMTIQDGFQKIPKKRRRPLQPFLLERFDGWNDSTMSLSSSECEPLSLRELLSYSDDNGKKIWDQLSLGYVEPSHGSSYLREEILNAQFGSSPSLHPECVNVCAPQEGIFLTMQAICEPGDHVIVVAPAYQSLHEIASSLGCDVESWWPEEEEMRVTTSDGTRKETKCFRFNPETLQDMLRSNQTKLVVTNFPHNPTGALPTREEFQSMVDMVQDSGAWFLNDEMYRGLEHPTGNKIVPPLPPITDCMVRGISIGGVSKSFGLPGLRIGWVVNSDESFQKRIAELKDFTTICPPAPSEALAFIALRAQDALWERSRLILANGLCHLRQFVLDQEEHPEYALEWYEPMGGTFAWVKFQSRKSPHQMTASDYCNTIRKKTGLMLIPSGLFPECQADDRIRLTYGKKETENLLKVFEQELQR